VAYGQGGVPGLHPSGLQVQTVLHLENLLDLSLREQTLFADCWEWLDWPEIAQRMIKPDHLDPLRLVEFVNQLEA
jgi:hypothetical protein